MSDIIEIYGYQADDLSDHGRKRWASKKCPFMGGKCKKNKGVCSVEWGGSEFMVCPHRLRCDELAMRDVCEDAFPGAKLIVRGGRKVTFLPNDTVTLAEQVKLGSGVHDGLLVHLVKGGRSEIVSVETQTMDITSNYRQQLAVYKRRTKDGMVVDVPCSSHGVNVANVRKRLTDQLIRKARSLEQLHVYRGMYFITIAPVWAHFEKRIGKLTPVPAGFSGTALNVMIYQLGRAVGDGQKREIVRCGEVLRFDLAEFTDRVAAGGVLPDPQELIDLIEVATGKSLGNVATKSAARKTVIDYFGQGLGDSLYKPAPRRKTRKSVRGRTRKAD